MLRPLTELRTMGVINITPDSFSETATRLMEGDALIKTLQQFKKIPGLIYDFGFESTAPMNSAVSLLDERNRFDDFFAYIQDFDLNNQWISFDTYKPQNYQYFEKKFKSRYQGCGFIFNDVSGVLDAEVLEFLKSKREQENFYYIYSSTHIPSREKVLNHMDFLLEGDIVTQTLEHFEDGLKKLKAVGMENKIILDPCFGFSKSFEQNWDLIHRFDEMVFKLNKAGIDCPCLVGVSKKSFLRKALPDSNDPFIDSEILHAKIIKELTSKNRGHLMFRAHDPFLVEKAYAIL